MKNLTQMMKQAQEMQGRIAELQERLAASEITGAAGGDMVQVTLNGKGEMRHLRIAPSLLDPADPGMVEDLIVAAHNDAKAKLEAFVAEEMGKITGGLNLPPGLGLPF